MDIGSLLDVRAIVINPLTNDLDLQHPDDLDALIDAYGPVRCVGVIGTDRTEWSDFGGPYVHESAQIRVQSGCHMPDFLERILCEEYTALRQTSIFCAV